MFRCLEICTLSFFPPSPQDKWHDVHTWMTQWAAQISCEPVSVKFFQLLLCSAKWKCACQTCGFVCVRLPKAFTFMCAGVWSLLVKIRVWFAPDLKHLLALLCQAFCLEKLLLGFGGCVARKELNKSLSFWSFRVRSSRWEGGRGSHGKVMHVSSHTWVSVQWNCG